MLDSVGERSPLEFSVRHSRRARRVRLTVSARDGLVVVVPAGARVDPAGLVASKADWARRALAGVEAKRTLHLGGPEALLPGSIELRSVDRVLCVEHRVSTRTPARCREGHGVLVVDGPDAGAALLGLSRWLDRTARAILPERLRALSEEHGLPAGRVRVTRARTRWGSCSSRATVSLNRSLVFLPPNLVDAVILHELAHTMVPDHSPRFWSYLATLDNAAMPHRAQLKGAGAYVPAWVDA